MSDRETPPGISDDVRRRRRSDIQAIDHAEYILGKLRRIDGLRIPETGAAYFEAKAALTQDVASLLEQGGRGKQVEIAGLARELSIARERYEAAACIAARMKSIILEVVREITAAMAEAATLDDMVRRIRPACSKLASEVLRPSSSHPPPPETVRERR